MRLNINNNSLAIYVKDKALQEYESKNTQQEYTIYI